MGNSCSMSYYAFKFQIANQYHSPTKMTRIESNDVLSKLSYLCVYKVIRAKTNNNTALIFCHGNACTIDNTYVDFFTNLNLQYDVYLLEYPGFGEFHSQEYTTKENIRSALHYLYTSINLQYTQITFLGHSIGAAVVLDYLHFYKLNNPAILLAPFMSIQMLILGNTSFMDDYVNFENIKGLSDVIIIHGEQDKVIPYNHSLGLSSKHNAKIINATHNDIFMKKEVIDVLKKI